MRRKRWRHANVPIIELEDPPIGHDQPWEWKPVPPCKYPRRSTPEHGYRAFGSTTSATITQTHDSDHHSSHFGSTTPSTTSVHPTGQMDDDHHDSSKASQTGYNKVTFFKNLTNPTSSPPLTNKIDNDPSSHKPRLKKKPTDCWTNLHLSHTINNSVFIRHHCQWWCLRQLF